MTWFTTFGCFDTWVSDGRSNFKNKEIEKVRKLVGAHHHITTAYSSLANGTVEVVNRLVLRAAQRNEAERGRMAACVAARSRRPQPSAGGRLGGIAPVTAFTSLPAKTPLAGFVHPMSKEVYVTDWLGAARQKHVTDIQVALDEMHRNVEVRSDKVRQQARGRRDRKSQVNFAGFSVGILCLSDRSSTV
ncbi:hypothetical protein AaE_009940 [Aphanomyces astaci]|uniref:Integrase catalytic domain-containing protein n=1 Tax=Aphanomyces astaci TaxID=112090 RepID=A0A6A5AAW3_APHAT|nr:hypothetical protein AaE_009940 [Aphanomyces astaci]